MPLPLSTRSLCCQVGVDQVSDIALAVKVDIDKVSLAEIVHASLQEIVLCEALLEVDALLVSEVEVDHGIDLQLLLAEANGLTHS